MKKLNDFDRLFGSARSMFAEADTSAPEVTVSDEEVKIETEDGTVVTTDAEQPSVEIEVPVADGEQIENVEVAVKYAEKCSRYAESMIDALEAGANAIIEDGEVKIGAVELVPEANNKSEGEVSLGDMNSERIITEETTTEPDPAFGE